MPHTTPRARPGLGVLSLFALTACGVAPEPTVGPSDVKFEAAAPAVRSPTLAVERPVLAPPQGTGIQTPSRSPSGSNVRLRRWSIEAFYVPFMAIEVDSDDNQGAGLSPDFDNGSGYGARFGIGDEDQGVGLMYIGSTHDEVVTSSDVRTDSIYADFHARALVWKQGTTTAWAKFNGGFGVANIDFDETFKDQTTGALQLRGVVQIEFSQRFSIDVGLGGFLWGVPGDTVAFGSMMTVGGTLRF